MRPAQSAKAKVHVAHLMFSYNIGGKERVITDAVTARRGGSLTYGVIVINDSFNPELVERLNAADAQVFLLKRRVGSRSPRAVFEFLRIIRERRVNLLHVRELGAIPLALLAKLARPRLRLLASVHNTHLMHTASGFQIWCLKTFFERVVVISKAVEADCVARGLQGVIVMNNAVDTIRFASVPRPAPSPTFRLICVARYLLRQKAQDILLRAVKLCVDAGLDVHCLLLGNLDGRNEADYETLKALARSLDIESRIEFIINKTNVEDYLGLSDAFVLPSRFEGFGNVVIEAMSAGAPVIISNVDGMTEIVTAGVNGLFVRPGDAQDLAEKITWAATHRDELEVIAKNGQAHAQHFDIKAYAERYEQIYDAALPSD